MSTGDTETDDPGPLQLTALSIDRLAGRVCARGRIAEGASVRRIVLAYADRRAEATPADDRCWSIDLDLGPPVEASPTLRLSWSGDGIDGIDGCWRLPLAGLHDATPFQHNVSAASFCRVSGRFECRGWGFPAPGSVTLLLNGRVLAHGNQRFQRTDVVEHHPWTRGMAIGWAFSGHSDRFCAGEVAMEVCSSHGVTRVVLRRDDTRYRLFNDGGGANWIRQPLVHALWRSVPALLRHAPLALHRSMLASARFGDRWRGAPDGLAAQVRRAVVDSLIDRGGHRQPLWLRLISDDLVLSAPGEDAVISRRFLLEASYEPGFLRWVVDLLQPGETVIDGGAAFGSFSLVAARAVGDAGRVVAIEANPATAARLRATLGRNRHGDRVVVEQVAVAHQLAKRPFADVSRSNAGGSRLLEAGENVAAVEADLGRMTVVSLQPGSRGQPVAQAVDRTKVRIEEVTVTTLDAICQQLALRDVALLKLDIEGGELNAVRGAAGLLDGSFGTPPIVALEFSRLVRLSGGTPEMLFDEFARRGWTCWRFQRGKDAGGPLAVVPDAARAPEHDNLVFVPPQRAARLRPPQR